MFFIIPSRNTCVLYGAPHCAAVVGSVEQERFNQFFVTCNKTGTHARDVGALRQAREDNQAVEVSSAQKFGSGQRAERRIVFVKINFRVTLVAADHKAVFVVKVKKPLPIFQ